MLSTLFIAAAGYIINDYFDRKADIINHPENVIVGFKIHRRAAIILHSVFNFIGVILGSYVALKLGYWKYIFIFIIVTFLLWLYSTTLKRKLLTGNITIAFITAMIPFIVFLFEFPGFYIKSRYSVVQHDVINFIMFIILGFSFFAFITSIIREIIKDIEDIRGDIRLGCKSIPIVWGVKKAASICFGLLIFSIIIIAVVDIFYLSKIVFIENLLIVHIYLAFIESLFILALILLSYAREKKHYSRLSLLIKLIMFFGVGFSAIFYFSFIN
ncbi:MAG: geranylgeranylglycerol-phosphate geranylgeranyltransferase [Marinilabiliales bacterium]